MNFSVAILILKMEEKSNILGILCFIISRKVKTQPRASLVVQWLRIYLPMQGTQVRALVREDPTCRRATKPVHHNY